MVLGGVVLGGGEGFVTAAMAGALVLEALFTLFNQLGLPSTARPAVQGVIIIAAVALAAGSSAAAADPPDGHGTRRDLTAPEPTG